MIIYPSIDLISGQCVRLVKGDYRQKTVYDDNPVSVALKWQASGAKWLHVVDLDGAAAGRPVNDETIREIVRALVIPVQVGGGNRAAADIRQRLSLGVSRVILGTAALRDPAFTREAAESYGEKIAVDIGASNGRAAAQGWQTVSEKPAAELLLELKAMGVKTVIYTDIDKDGMMEGPNVEMYAAAARAGMDIIASGGVSCMEDLARLAPTGVHGVIIGKALYENAVDLHEAVRIYG